VINGTKSKPAIVTIVVEKRNMLPTVVVKPATLDTTVTEDFPTSKALKYMKDVVASWFKDPEGDPLTYSAKSKDGKLKVEITDIREIVPPKMDEEFCKQIGVKDEADLKNNLAEGLAAQKKDAAKTKAINEAIDKLIESNPFEVPQCRIVDLIRWTINRNVQDEKDRVEPTEEQIQQLSPEAVHEIKKHRILEFVAVKEKIRPNQAAVDARLKEMANAYHVDFETLKGHFRQSGRINQLRDELRFQMAADFLVGIRPAAEESKESK